MDYDETKYVLIAKDAIHNQNWIDLKLNGNIFEEYSPLLFWIINFSFLIFGEISTFAARIPFALFSIIGIIFLFIVISKILTRLYAFIISLILATCFGFIVFSHLATNDMLFVNSTMLSVLSSFLILLTKQKHTKHLLWFCVYFSSAIAVLSGGLFGLLPLLIMITMHIFAGKLKDVFQPKNLFIGICTLIIVLSPWFIYMIKNNGIDFIKDFFSYYNIFKTAGIRKYLYNIALFICGFMPWICAFLWIIGSKFNDICNSVISYIKDDSQDKLGEKWKRLSKTEKFLSLNTIVFFTSLIFVILYGAKYTYLILFLMVPASCISGHYWYEYIFKKQRDKSIFFATILPNILFIIFSTVLIFGHNHLNKLSVYGYGYLFVPIVATFTIIPIISICSVILKGRKIAFIANLILMISLSFIISPNGYNFIVANSGQSELIKFANKANKDKVKISAFLPSKKYSLVYYYDKNIDFHNNNDYEWLKNHLENNKNDYVVVEIKSLWPIEEQNIKYQLLASEKRYCIIKYLPKAIEKEMEQESEPEVIIQ
ncbi:glycosyltransferase family 39 protein [bacterium]|nr:glycosyltransferase family 39 protein [bacterium]